MPQHYLTARGSLYVTVPLTLVLATTYTVSRLKAASAQQPLQFVPCGEPTQDSEKLEHIRDEWKERNHGIGLRDV
ncbi:hypothetical protein DFQ30_009159, partial [Apophysomyces sp. BC1015]